MYDTERIKTDYPVSEIAARYTPLTREGDEFRGLCPFHKEATPSFTVKDAKGWAHCFGCGWHGDVIQLVADMHHVSFPEACAILTKEAPTPAAMKPGKEREHADIYAGLVAAGEPPPEHWPVAGEALRAWNPKRQRWTHYRPAMVFPYRSTDGRMLGCVVRIDLEQGKKLTPCLRWVTRPEHATPHWSHMPLDRPRALYRLDEIAKGMGEVIWVEGEKAADAATRMFGPRCTTSVGGGKSLAHVDWSALKGRPLLIWGDADIEGERTVLGYSTQEKRVPGVAELAHAAGAGPIRYVPWDKAKPKGWDAADAEKEGPAFKCYAAIESQAKAWQPGMVPKPPAAAPRKPAATMREEFKADTGRAVPRGGERFFGPEDRPAAPPVEHPFRILGHLHNTFYFHPKGTQSVLALSAAQFTEGRLLNLAPLAHWERHYPHKTKPFSVVEATDALMRAAESVGVFSLDRLRGRGAWIDAGRPVVHTGDTVIIDGETYRPADAPSRYIYELGEPIHFERASPASTDEAQLLPKLFARFSWEQPLSGHLLAGFCIIAPVCGALDWRPHCWIRGPARSGKTTAKEMAQNVIGPFALHRDGSTTEAHLRQSLNHDGRPIVIDEFEAEDKAASARVQSVIGLSRIASSGATVGKGGKDGTAMEYTMRSSFLFSSINPSVKEHADDTRISQLALREPERSAEAGAAFSRLLADIAATVTPGYAARMFARTVKHLPTLLTNTRIFAQAGFAHFGDRRTAQQIGTMLAGLHLCYSTDEVTFDAALAFIKKRASLWGDYTALEAQGDERKLIMTIATIGRRVTFDSGPARDFTIGELILIGCNKQRSGLISDEHAERVLGPLGIKIIDASHFAIANQAPQLRRLLDGTPWAAGWRGTLRALPSASPAEPLSYAPGLKERGTYLSIDVLTGEEPLP